MPRHAFAGRAWPPLALLARSCLVLAGGIALAAVLVSTPVWSQESEDTFFDQEAFNACAGFLAAEAHPDGPEARRYADWADGYLTAAAEDGSLRRYNMRSGTRGLAVAWLVEFCKERPLESFRAAVAAMAQAWRGAHAP